LLQPKQSQSAKSTSDSQQSRQAEESIPSHLNYSVIVDFQNSTC